MEGTKPACAREPCNIHDRYTVAVKRRRIIIGHLPQKLLRLCSLFLRWKGTIFRTVTGARRYLEDLPQGSLEVLCTLFLSTSPKNYRTSRNYYQRKLTLHCVSARTTVGMWLIMYMERHLIPVSRIKLNQY